MTKYKGFTTRAIHENQTKDATGSVIPPIYSTSTFEQAAPGVNNGYDYGRSGNPTRDAYEKAVAVLENGARGFAFASGMAAIAAVLELLPHSSHIIISDDLYGGTYRLLEHIKSQSSNFSHTYVDMTNAANIEAAIQPNTKMIWVETPSNPLLKIADLSAIAIIAQKYNLITAIDNTLCSPYIQRPLEHGFDISVHSATKFINGHSDMIGGVAVVRENNQLAERLYKIQNGVGAVQGPFECFLAHRGLKTLALRMEKHCSNAFELAILLENHPKIERVIYPGLKSHPQHDLAKTQMHGHYGAIISIFIKGGKAKALEFMDRCNLFSLAVSLGGVESLIQYPYMMTHGVIPAAEKAAKGITENLVRLAVGIEDLEDLAADILQALE